MSKNLRNPSELRSMFGSNLRRLSQDYPSISELSRQLGINRTQFNRYLAGESFPRPDVLARICAFFGIDARVLLEPVDTISNAADPISSVFLNEFLSVGAHNISEDVFPSGFYRFSRHGFMVPDQFVVGVVHVKREGANTYIRGFEPREAMASQGLPASRDAREFRGLVMQQEEGVAAVITRRNAMTCSFNYLHRVPSYENNFWIGYVARTVRESISSPRASRMVYEHLGHDMSKALNAARTAGYRTLEQINPFHKRLLQIGDPFR